MPPETNRRRRRRVVIVGGTFEQAERADAPATQDAWLTFAQGHQERPAGASTPFLGGGVGRRLAVLTDWATARVGRPQSQVIEGELTTVDR